MVLYKKKSVYKRRPARRTFKRRNPRTTRKPTVSGLVSRVNKLALQVRRQQPERMHFTKNVSSSFGLTAGVGNDGHYLTMFDYPTLGDDIYQRHGRKITITSINWKGVIEMPVSDFNDVSILLLIVQDLHVTVGSGDQFSMAGLFSRDAKSRYSPHCLRNNDRWKQFRIWSAKRITIHRSSPSVANRIPFNIVRKLTYRVAFQPDNTVPITPPFFCLCLADTGDSIANTGPYISSQLRYNYLDA